MRFRAKNSAIREYIPLLKANQIAGITSDFKMDVINILMVSFRGQKSLSHAQNL